MNPYDWLDDFKKKEGVNLIEITLENRDLLPLQITEMVTKDNEAMQRKITKAKKYSEEKDRFIILDDSIEVHSEHGIRTIKNNNGNYICDCDFYLQNGTCSHIMAIINSNLTNQER